MDDGAATRVQDRVDYLMPFGRLGALALPLVRRDLRRIFDYRQAGSRTCSDDRDRLGPTRPPR